MTTPNQGRFNINLLDACILIFHVSKAAKDKDVGFEDAERTLDQMLRALRANRVFTVKQDVLESALWSCNLLSQKREFHSLDGREFRAFVRDLIDDKTLRFDEFYNVIEKKKKPRN
jgi:hypothetical protein